MRRSYLFAHWGLTLLAAPVAAQILQYILLPNPHRISGLLEVYPIVLVFSIAFSLPTLLVYAIAFYSFSRYKVNILVSKLALVSISVLGIYVTMTIIGGSMSQETARAYSLTALMIGLLLRLRYSKRSQSE